MAREEGNHRGDPDSQLIGQCGGRSCEGFFIAVDQGDGCPFVIETLRCSRPIPLAATPSLALRVFAFL